MLGLGIATLGTMASFHFAKEAGEREVGVWPTIANVASWIAAIALGIGALSTLA